MSWLTPEYLHRICLVKRIVESGDGGVTLRKFLNRVKSILTGDTALNRDIAITCFSREGFGNVQIGY